MARPMKRVTVTFAVAVCVTPAIRGLSVGGPRLTNFRHDGTPVCSRRDLMSSLLAPLLISPFPATAVPDARATVMLRLNSSNEKAGLKLSEVTIGTPPKTAVAVDGVVPNSLADRAGVVEGLVLLDYDNQEAVIEKIHSGPYPLELKFFNLAAGGDAIGDLGKPLVTAKDALDLAKSTSTSTTSISSDQDQYVMRILKQSSCNMQSRRGDVLEMNYEARIKSPEGPIYDSSQQRGTGQPYQFVLGSGDMIPGVDRGLYDMCPGDVRALEIPPVLGYGPRASKSFDIPSGSRLYWTVELVAVNSVRQGDERDRDEIEGRAAW